MSQLGKESHDELARALNKPIIGGGGRSADGKLFWAALRSADGKSIPLPPAEAFSNPIVIKSRADLKEDLKRLRNKKTNDKK